MLVCFPAAKVPYNPGYKPWAYIISKALFRGLITGGGGGLIKGGDFALEKRIK